jgi:hypothetical protein
LSGAFTTAAARPDADDDKDLAMFRVLRELSVRRLLPTLVLSSAFFVAASASADRLEPAAPFASAPADERFYAVLFSYQSSDNAIESSHTFGSFYRTTGSGDRRRVVETQTISWLPVSGKISLARPAEPGVNVPLNETLAAAEARGLQITVNGPFEIQPELFRRAAAQAARLARGELKYKAFNRFGRDTSKNCIHALADIVDEPVRLNSGAARGQDATLLVIRHFQAFFVTRGVDEQSLPSLASLELERYAAPPTAAMAAGAVGR